MRIKKDILGKGPEAVFRYLKDSEGLSEGDIILPPEKRDEARRIGQRINEIYIRDPKRRRKAAELFEKLYEKLEQCGGEIRLLASKGGARNNYVEVINEELLKYVEIKIAGLVILEPIEYHNNATYILFDNEKLRENYKKTREQLVKERKALKLSHEANEEYDDYNYDGITVIDIIEAINADRESFLIAASPDNLYSNITRVLRDYQLLKAIKESGISIDDISKLIESLNEKGVGQLEESHREFTEKAETIIAGSETSVVGYLKHLEEQKKRAKKSDFGGRE